MSPSRQLDCITSRTASANPEQRADFPGGETALDLLENAQFIGRSEAAAVAFRGHAAVAAASARTVKPLGILRPTVEVAARSR